MRRDTVIDYHYQMYETAHLALSPARFLSDLTRLYFTNPMNPMTHTALGNNLATSAELFERLARPYARPAFGLTQTMVRGKEVAIHERVVRKWPFCELVHFQREVNLSRPQQRLLIVAPLSGHYATLLRGTVEAFLPTHEVYITDWSDARMVPLPERFDLDDYIDYLITIFHVLSEEPFGEGLHAIGVCQPCVPLTAAVARMEADGCSFAPQSMTLMSGPIDTRRSPTLVNVLAERRGTDWFRRHCISTVPFPYPAMGRPVCSGSLQLSSFMAMNIGRHVNACVAMLNHLVRGDDKSAKKHRKFYDEFLTVMDLTSEFYLQTIETVFVRHALPKNEMMHHGQRVDLRAIRRTALMTVEGEKDDITGLGQTHAAQELCSNIAPLRKVQHTQNDVGHYGVFSGSRFRTEIAPRISNFIANVTQRPKTIGYSKARISERVAYQQRELDNPLTGASIDSFTCNDGELSLQEREVPELCQ
jgi:poly(3-hydroxybutyrate) depolymerase